MHLIETKPTSFKVSCYKKELDTAQGRTLGISTFGSPTSFACLRWSIRQNIVWN
ncbi:hypothetical protein TPHV1_240023 [Treponema phagedenis]|uniref:Uncharacterized protein n=1 Tax=Treponema phagedenis TaxID=162 RepID=A0A0B7GU18_TREPH|nr:hypothetical protein TPHV1_240023 [Treponema phagedenis]